MKSIEDRLGMYSISIYDSKGNIDYRRAMDRLLETKEFIINNHNKIIDDIDSLEHTIMDLIEDSK